MTAKNERPKWEFKEMSESDFKKIVDIGRIGRVEAHWAMTGADTSEEWLVVTGNNGKTLRLPNGWQNVMVFVGYSSVPGLFDLNYTGKRMLDRLKEIDAFEASNRRDRATYERLKKKFEGSAQ